MTEEEKDLLLKDLCARLPYIPIIQIEEHDWNNLHIDVYDTPFKSYYLEPFIIGEIEIKPYLRPMLSMTDEEIKEVTEIDKRRIIFSSRHLTWHLDGQVIDFFNRKMLDWRGLIPAGLALEATEGMYKIE